MIVTLMPPACSPVTLGLAKSRSTSVRMKNLSGCVMADPPATSQALVLVSGENVIVSSPPFGATFSTNTRDWPDT